MEGDVSEFKFLKTEMFFQPAGSKELVHLGSCDPKDVLMTSTVSIGDKTLTQSFTPGDAEAMEKATNELARFVMGTLDD